MHACRKFLKACRNSNATTICFLIFILLVFAFLWVHTSLRENQLLLYTFVREESSRELGNNWIRREKPKKRAKDEETTSNPTTGKLLNSDVTFLMTQSARVV